MNDMYEAIFFLVIIAVLLTTIAKLIHEKRYLQHRLDQAELNMALIAPPTHYPDEMVPPVQTDESFLDMADLRNQLSDQIELTRISNEMGETIYRELVAEKRSHAATKGLLTKAKSK